MGIQPGTRDLLLQMVVRQDDGWFLHEALADGESIELLEPRAIEGSGGRQGWLLLHGKQEEPSLFVPTVGDASQNYVRLKSDGLLDLRIAFRFLLGDISTRDRSFGSVRARVGHTSGTIHCHQITVESDSVSDSFIDGDPLPLSELPRVAAEPNFGPPTNQPFFLAAGLQNNFNEQNLVFSARWHRWPGVSEDSSDSLLLLSLRRRATSVGVPPDLRRALREVDPEISISVFVTGAFVQVTGASAIAGAAEDPVTAATREALEDAQPLTMVRHDVFYDALRIRNNPARFDQLWNLWVRRYTLALATSKEGAEFSFLPALAETEDPPRPRLALAFSAHDLTDSLRLDVDDVVPEERPLSAGKVTVGEPRLVLNPSFGAEPRREVEIGLRQLHAHNGQPVKSHALVAPVLGPPPRSQSSSPRLGPLVLDVWLPRGDASQRVRIGALDLDFATSPTLHELQPRGRVLLDLRPPLVGRVETELDLKFPLLGIRPGGQDETPDETAPRLVGSEGAFGSQDVLRERPVLVPVAADGANTRTYQLNVVERTDSPVRILQLEILDKASQAAQTPEDEALPEPLVIVIDREPFLVTSVSIPPLVEDAELGIEQVANWSNRDVNGAGWELRYDAVRLALPPQGLGEQYERRTGEGLESGAVSQVRLTPTARFSLSPSPFPQRFVEAPWNLRRLFGFPGQRNPGAPIQHLSFELLYGMSTSVEPQERLLLSELFARLGRPAEARLPVTPPWPATPKQLKAYEAFESRWREDLRRHQSRLAVLEPWSPLARSPTLTLRDGVEAQLRSSAALRYPVPEGPPPDAASPDGAPNVPDGLAGGVAWGFESANVYEATWREPRSLEAELRRPYFSTLGGWGWQKAVFDEGRQAIYADVAMGRTFFYALERIGRIGVLWNRAKHVIVYERTVAPSLQFTGQQNWHLARPLVRKVEEYVELLETERRYPESAGSELASGPLLAARFPDSKIPVDSRWGADVGSLGWQVPLWRPREDPRVYPKPSICLEVATSPDSGRDRFDVEIDEPQKLSFYTDTREGTGADPDLWESIPGVDFVDLPTPRPPAVQPMLPASPDLHFPSAPETEPGFGRFSLRLVSPERGVNVVGRRTSASSIEAVISNLTLQRSDPRSLASGDPVARLVTEAGATLLRELAIAQRQVMAALPPHPHVPTRQQIEAATKPLEELRQQLLGDGSGSVAERVLESACTAIEQALRDELRQAIEELEGRLRRTLAPVLALQEGTSRRIYGPQGLLSHLEEAAGAARTLANELEPCPSDARQRLQEFLDAETGAKAERLRRDALEALRRLDAETQAGLTTVRIFLLGLLGRFERWIEDAQDGVSQLDALVEGAAADWRREIDAITIPPNDALAELATRLTVFEAIAGRIDRTLSNHLGNLRAQFTSPPTAESEIPDWQERAKGLVDDIRSQATKLLDELQETLDTLLHGGDGGDGIVGLRSLIEEFIASTQAALQLAIAGAFRLFDEQLESGVQQLHDALHRLLETFPDPPTEEICQKAAARCRELAGALDGSAEEIREALAPFAEVQGSEIRIRLDARIAAVRRRLTVVLDDQIEALVTALCRAAAAAVAELMERVLALIAAAQAALQSGAQAALAALQRLGDGVATLADGLLDLLAEQIARLPRPEFQLPGAGLRLFRAWGKAPSVPGLDFSLPSLGYYFQDFNFPDFSLPHVDLTPVTAFLNRLGSQLRGLGIRLPTIRLDDRATPFELPSFDLASIFPDFGGIRLDGLFPGLKMPKISSDVVKVTHGIDRQSRRAWAQADVDMPYDRPTDILPFDPLNVRLANARFAARTRVEGDLEGRTSSRTTATLSSTWEIAFAGTTLVRLKDTVLSHDNGRTRFHVDPNKVELPGALQFLSDLLVGSGLADTGITVSVLPGAPPGLKSQLLLPLPNLSVGAFSVTNLQLLTTLTLGFSERNFFVRSDFAVGSPDRPFALRVGILVGGGYVTVAAQYTPATGTLDAETRIAIAAGAGFDFSFGPVRGGVWFLLAVEVGWSSRSGGGLSIALLVILRGEAQVFGFISIGLSLRLEARYNADRSITAAGRLELEVKIGSFFKKKVSVRVRYVLARGSGGARRAAPAPAALLLAAPQQDPPDEFDIAAGRYIDMLLGGDVR